MLCLNKLLYHTQIYLQLVALWFYVYDAQLLHVSSIYPGRLQRVNFFSTRVASMETRQQIIGKLYTHRTYVIRVIQ